MTNKRTISSRTTAFVTALMLTLVMFFPFSDRTDVSADPAGVTMFLAENGGGLSIASLDQDTAISADDVLNITAKEIKIKIDDKFVSIDELPEGTIAKGNEDVSFKFSWELPVDFDHERATFVVDLSANLKNISLPDTVIYAKDCTYTIRDDKLYIQMHKGNSNRSGWCTLEGKLNSEDDEDDSDDKLDVKIFDEEFGLTVDPDQPTLTVTKAISNSGFKNAVGKGVYRGEDGKYYQEYTIKVTAKNGDAKNVTLTDIADTTRYGKVTKVMVDGVETAVSSGEGEMFSVKLGTITKGKSVTVVYLAEITDIEALLKDYDPADSESNPYQNTASVTSSNADPDSATAVPHVEDPKISSKKATGYTSNGKTLYVDEGYVRWKITVNLGSFVYMDSALCEDTVLKDIPGPDHEAFPPDSELAALFSKDGITLKALDALAADDEWDSKNNPSSLTKSGKDFIVSKTATGYEIEYRIKLADGYERTLENGEKTIDNEVTIDLPKTPKIPESTSTGSFNIVGIIGDLTKTVNDRNVSKTNHTYTVTIDIPKVDRAEFDTITEIALEDIITVEAKEGTDNVQFGSLNIAVSAYLANANGTKQSGSDFNGNELTYTVSKESIDSYTYQLLVSFSQADLDTIYNKLSAKYQWDTAASIKLEITYVYSHPNYFTKISNDAKATYKLDGSPDIEKGPVNVTLTGEYTVEKSANNIFSLPVDTANGDMVWTINFTKKDFNSSDNSTKWQKTIEKTPTSTIANKIIIVDTMSTMHKNSYDENAGIRIDEDSIAIFSSKYTNNGSSSSASNIKRVTTATTGVEFYTWEKNTSTPNIYTILRDNGLITYLTDPGALISKYDDYNYGYVWVIDISDSLYGMLDLDNNNTISVSYVTKMRDAEYAKNLSDNGRINTVQYTNMATVGINDNPLMEDSITQSFTIPRTGNAAKSMTTEMVPVNEKGEQVSEDAEDMAGYELYAHYSVDINAKKAKLGVKYENNRVDITDVTAKDTMGKNLEFVRVDSVTITDKDKNEKTVDDPAEVAQYYTYDPTDNSLTFHEPGKTALNDETYYAFAYTAKVKMIDLTDPDAPTEETPELKEAYTNTVSLGFAGSKSNDSHTSVSWSAYTYAGGYKYKDATASITIDGTKTWADISEDQALPDFIDVKLTATYTKYNGEVDPEKPVKLYRISAKDKKISVSTDGGRTFTGIGSTVSVSPYDEDKKELVWSFAIPNLPSKMADGTTVTYEIDEIEIDGYAAEYTATTLEDSREGDLQTGAIKIALGITNTNVLSEVSVTKKWHDTYDEASKTYPGRPDEITVQLMQDGKEYDDPATADIDEGKAVLNEANGWMYTWKDLPKYAEDNTTLIEYTISEVDVPEGYISEISSERKNVFTVTNTEITSVSAEKVWDDNENSGNTRPDEITVRLIANGAAYNGDGTVALNDANGWKCTWNGLPKYDANGAKIAYDVEEVGNTAKYRAVKSGDMESGYVITNQLIGTSIVIDKKDIAKNIEIDGAVLAICDEDGNIVKDKNGNELTWTSRAGSTWLVTDLVPGVKYVLKETVVPDGVEAGISTDIVFTIDAEGVVEIISGNAGDYLYDKANGMLIVNNTLKTEGVYVYINKKDIAKNEEIDGAVLTVYYIDEDGAEQEYAHWVSSSGETWILKDLVPGREYILRETVVPENVAAALTAEIRFTVDENGNVHVINSSEVIEGKDYAFEGSVLVVNDTLKVEIPSGPQGGPEEPQTDPIEIVKIYEGVDLSALSETEREALFNKTIFKLTLNGVETRTRPVWKDGKAVISIDRQEGRSLRSNRVYYVEETQSPDGYDRSDIIYMFIIDDKGHVSYSVDGGKTYNSGTPTCENKKSEVKVPIGFGEESIENVGAGAGLTEEPVSARDYATLIICILMSAAVASDGLLRRRQK